MRNVTYRRPEEALLFASDAVYLTQFRNLEMRGTFHHISSHFITFHHISSHFYGKESQIIDKPPSLQGAWILPKCCNLSSCASHRSRLTNIKSTAESKPFDKVYVSLCIFMRFLLVKPLESQSHMHNHTQKQESGLGGSIIHHALLRLSSF